MHGPVSRAGAAAAFDGVRFVTDFCEDVAGDFACGGGVCANAEETNAATTNGTTINRIMKPQL